MKKSLTKFSVQLHLLKEKFYSYYTRVPLSSGWQSLRNHGLQGVERVGRFYIFNNNTLSRTLPFEIKITIVNKIWNFSIKLITEI
jgi:hypothetical protein